MTLVYLTTSQGRIYFTFSTNVLNNLNNLSIKYIQPSYFTVECQELLHDLHQLWETYRLNIHLNVFNKIFHASFTTNRVMNITEQSTIKNDLARIKSLSAHARTFYIGRVRPSMDCLKKYLEPTQRGDRFIRLKYILNYIRNLEPCYKGVTSQEKKPCTEVPDIEFISKQPCQFFAFTFLSLQFKFGVHSCIFFFFFY